MQQNQSTPPPPVPFTPAPCPVLLGSEDLARVSGAGLLGTSLPAGNW